LQNSHAHTGIGVVSDGAGRLLTLKNQIMKLIEEPFADQQQTLCAVPPKHKVLPA
jgi:hypothetical protein